MATSNNPYAPSSQAVSKPVEPQEVTEAPEPVEEVVDPQSVPEGPAAEVLAWVGEDKDRAQQALDAEEEGQQRVGLTKKLKELV